MHLEVLVEDASGAVVVDAALQRILPGTGSGTHTFRIHAYRGIGRIPPGLRPGTPARQRILLDQLPRLLRGYGRSLPPSAAVVVVVDLDRQNCLEFKQELRTLLEACHPHPVTLFRIAIEEIEAWLLGDVEALKAAYPRARQDVLDAYEPDSICGTWEVLADAVDQGGAQRLRDLGWPHIGAAKHRWAADIAPHLDVERNRSKSFRVFRDGVRRLVTGV